MIHNANKRNMSTHLSRTPIRSRTSPVPPLGCRRRLSFLSRRLFWHRRPGRRRGRAPSRRCCHARWPVRSVWRKVSYTAGGRRCEWLPHCQVAVNPYRTTCWRFSCEWTRASHRSWPRTVRFVISFATGVVLNCESFSKKNVILWFTTGMDSCVTNAFCFMFRINFFRYVDWIADALYLIAQSVAINCTWFDGVNYCGDRRVLSLRNWTAR